MNRTGPFLVAHSHSHYGDPALDPTPDSVTEQAFGDEEGVFVFPASLEQIRYWTLDQLDGASTASNMAIAARLEGAVDDQIVEQAIHALVERHEALRTTFRMVDGQLCQVISEETTFSLTITDLRALPEDERSAAGEAAVEEHSHARADLAKGPAFFARLIHLSDRLHFLAFTMHHIVCDGWSNGILIRDFTDFYGAFAQNRSPSLPDLPFQFADFTVWQQNWLQSSAADAALSYWRAHIRRDMPAVDLPTDRPRLPQKSYPGHIESTLLPADLTARLKAYCRAHNATMHQVLLAAFEALIARYANQNEFLLGSTIANRTQPGMENVVGRFANPQVILADVNGNPSFSELLGRVVAWSTEAYAHQDLPFSRLMEEFQMDQAGATSQFLQVYFVYQKAFMQPQEAGSLKVIPRPSVSGGVNFDLLVSIVERAEGPRLQMEYNTVLFRPERIRSLIDMYQRVLHAVMEDDSITVTRLPLQARRKEQAELQVQHPSPGLAYPTLSISEWLEALETALADSTAVIDGDNAISWRTLLERSKGIQLGLAKLGILPGTKVALRMEQSWETVAFAWALLHIGATVLPLPTTATQEQWSEMLVQLEPKLALASSNFAHSLSGITSFSSLLSSQMGGSQSESEFNHSLPAHSQHPNSSSVAWMTIERDNLGKLQTFEISNETTLRRMISAARALDLRFGDAVFAAPAQSSLDAWVDLMLPLIAGAKLVYPGRSGSESTSLPLTSLIDEHRLSFVFASKTELLQVIQDRWEGDYRLNMVLRGGILSPALAQRVSSIPLRLWAMASSSQTAGPFALARISGARQFSYLAISPERLTVLDDSDQATPAGVFGELATFSSDKKTRTRLLSRTLENQDSITEQMRWLSGQAEEGFEILDSVDRVVRLHGYRLRLGELEDVLWRNPAISDTAATILPLDGVSTLVTYYTPFSTSVGGTDTAVREQFRNVAPGMVAGAELIAVPSIPRHPDGSVNFALLPQPGKARNASTEEYVPARDDLESSLVAIWEDVLGVRPVGIRSSFFKLGGYSLMIVRLFARINKQLGTSLPITTIFNAPTVEQLADIVRGRAYYSSLVPVRTAGSQPPFFMIHSYLLYQGIPAVLGEDYPFYGLREMDTDAESMTVEQRAATYFDAMRSVQPHGPYYIGGWCAAGPLAVETARQIIAAGEKVGFLVLFDSWRPGYAAELAREQAGTPEMTFRARMGRKYRFHRNRWRTLTAKQKFRYVTAAVGSKFASVRNRIYLKNWAAAEWLCRRFGLALPAFMHNVSLTTLNSLSEYRGVEPYEGSLTLIRAKEAPYFPGAQDHCGWNSIVKGGVEVLWAPGDHESMFLEPHLNIVGELLRKSISEALAIQRS